jgi:outer membrane protein assembly factor BamB
MGARNGVEQLICLDVNSGKELWSTDLGAVFENNWGDGPRGTPTVDGDRVYALSGEGDLVCARINDGSVAWKANMSDFGGSIPEWGYAESPLIDGQKVVCTPGGAQGAVVALNKLTGEKIWQSADFTDEAQYASLVIADHPNARQYVQLTMKSVAGVEAATGKLLWRVDWPGRTAVIPTPIYRDGSVYVTSGYRAGCKLLKLGDDHEVTEVYDEEACKVMQNQHGGVLLFEDHLYGYSDSRGWVCQDWLTGEQVWRERSAFGKGAVAFADGMLYCLSENEGEVVLVEASAEGWNEKGRFVLQPQTEQRKPSGKIWTHPVIVNGKLFLRDQELLFCFDVKGKP